MPDKINVLGLMSGSSLDGLDACLCAFQKLPSGWNFEIEEVRTFAFPDSIESELRRSYHHNQEKIIQLDSTYGKWIGQTVKDLAKRVQLIGLHGHTTIHDPQNKISKQIGDPEIVARITGKPVVANYRMADILLGGEGAPLVPMGEKWLFPEHDGFLNLGGICNASFNSASGKWTAGDIGPFNQVLNFYANKLGYPFDQSGDLARSGQLNHRLLDEWNQIDFFKSAFPKSLSNDWVRDHFFDLPDSPKDILRTFTSFITDRIADQINFHDPKKVMISGGGAFHSFAVESLQEKTRAQLALPSEEIISFKEALIFAFLGLLRHQNQYNVLSSCTGAREDSCSGDIYLPS